MPARASQLVRPAIPSSPRTAATTLVESPGLTSMSGMWQSVSVPPPTTWSTRVHDVPPSIDLKIPAP